MIFWPTLLERLFMSKRTRHSILRHLVRGAWFCMLLIAFCSHAQLETPLWVPSLTDSDALFNADKYYEKAKLVKNDAMPEVSSEDFWQVMSYLKNDPENHRSVSLQISNADWWEFMTHYFSQYRFSERAWYDVTGVIHDNWSKEAFTWQIKHRWNYSTKSLKVSFRLKLEEMLASGDLVGKKKIIFRSLTFDRSWVWEASYFDAYQQLHETYFWEKGFVAEPYYYWLFINGQLYGYFAVMDDTKDGLVENAGKFMNEETDCMVKAKTWKPAISANMQYHPNYEDYDAFYEMYRIEEGDKERCHQEMLWLMKLIRDKDTTALLSKFHDVRQLIFYGQMQDLMENKAGIFQNYILTKTGGKWHISPWDGDLVFDGYRPVDESVVRENLLLDAAYDALSQRYSYDELKNAVVPLVKSYYATHKDAILLDRHIWARYVPQEDPYITKNYYTYSSVSPSREKLDSLTGKRFTEIIRMLEHGEMPTYDRPE